MLLFSSGCHKKFDGVQHVEILYHPIQQMIVVRESSQCVATSTQWIDAAGVPITRMASKEFSEAVYENMCWKKEYSYRFRGITKERNGIKIMIFYLDEPQILLNARQKEKLISSGYNFNNSTAYIPYHEDPDDDNESEYLAAEYGYPEEWNHSIGMSYEMRTKRDSLISSLTDGDILTSSKIVDNPMIGHIPSRQELQDELNQLMMSM